MSVQMPIPPCYDAMNKVDCPNRSANCHAACDLWRDYEIERDKAYEKRYIERCNTIGFDRTHCAALKYIQRRGLARKLK